MDREDKSLHHLTFIAETDTSPTLSAYYHMIVQVIDQNDNTPMFMKNPYEISLSEAVAPHTSVIRMQATDEDYGPNGEITYSFHGGDSSQKLASIFSIDPHQGWITTQGMLDYEMETSYELIVVATDNGSPQKSATASVSIQLIDKNDNPPVFSQRHYTAAIHEGALIGYIIIQLEVSDKDTEATSDNEFFIVQGDPQGKFQVSSKSTNIVLNLMIYILKRQIENRMNTIFIFFTGKEKWRGVCRKRVGQGNGVILQIGCQGNRWDIHCLLQNIY